MRAVASTHFDKVNEAVQLGTAPTVEPPFKPSLPPPVPELTEVPLLVLAAPLLLLDPVALVVPVSVVEPPPDKPPLVSTTLPSGSLRAPHWYDRAKVAIVANWRRKLMRSYQLGTFTPLAPMPRQTRARPEPGPPLVPRKPRYLKTLDLRGLTTITPDCGRA
jgi:hypothetical protein